MNFAPIARIVLRYVVGAGIMGSQVIGDRLASDPDLVLYVSLAIGAAVEAGYLIAKRKGWAT
jgi:preprotein translocase subunit Sec61beta